jgi:hypothetical protein
MNARTPFWPLVRSELGIGSYSTLLDFMGLIYCFTGWGVMGTFPMFALLNISLGYPAQQVATVDIWLTFVWLALAGILFGNALIPQKSGAMTRIKAFEYFFTRAVDRKKLYRAKIAAGFFVMLAPVFADLLASLFYGSDVRVCVCWLAWSGILVLLLVQLSCALIGKYVKGSGWLMFVFLGAPIMAILTVAIFRIRTTILLYQGNFVFFSTHPVLAIVGLAVLAASIQLYSERRFAEVEIP